MYKIYLSAASARHSATCSGPASSRHALLQNRVPHVAHLENAFSVYFGIYHCFSRVFTTEFTTAFTMFLA